MTGPVAQFFNHRLIDWGWKGPSVITQPNLMIYTFYLIWVPKAHGLNAVGNLFSLKPPPVHFPIRKRNVLGVLLPANPSSAPLPSVGRLHLMMRALSWKRMGESHEGLFLTLSHHGQFPTCPRALLTVRLCLLLMRGVSKQRCLGVEVGRGGLW